MPVPVTRAAPRVVVVEDDAVVAETLVLYLEQAGFAVEHARDGVTGLALAQSPAVALVILDLMIPGLSGQEVCRRLRETSRVPILMLTARVSEDDRVAGLQMGADDYVPKPFSPREVVARVEALLRRAGEPAAPSASDCLRWGALEIDRWSRRVRVAGRAVSLTPTEFRLLETMARHPGRTFSRSELLARVFGPDYDGFDRTIDTHVTNLRRKIESGDARCVITVHGVGYRLAGPED
jgi:two-component system OmpR family response regulator